MLIVSSNGEEFREQILEIVKNHPEGLTLQDLSEMTGYHRQTVRSHILWLEGANVIYRRRIGAVTLHYLKEKWDRLKK